jgi:carboxypeptidase Q
LIRSVTPFSIESPHTGGVSYDGNYPLIPAAAISVEDAEMLLRMKNRGQKIKLNLYLENHTEDDCTSYNVVAEVKGSEHPE